MGKAIARVAPSIGIEIVAVIHPSAERSEMRKISAESVIHADVLVEFTRPDSVIDNIQAALAIGKPIVAGTTGWESREAEVRNWVDRFNGTVVYGANFSLGANLLYSALRRLSDSIADLTEYDACIIEAHHKGKVDSPSGTAREMARIMLSSMPRYSGLIEGNLSRQKNAGELQIASVRCGHTIGEHIARFDSELDTIELRHTLKTRDSLAHGALVAAKWAYSNQGMTAFRDLVESRFRPNGQWR
jgi:4-hydroxy-tetrahydrodipicolinate reductase